MCFFLTDGGSLSADSGLFSLEVVPRGDRTSILDRNEQHGSTTVLFTLCSGA